MNENALDRVSRALNLIPFILNNQGLSIQQLAQRFNSTPAQISKDLSLLHMCGLPGYTHLELLNIDFEDPNHVAVNDPQVLDQPRSLTQVEALTLVLGLQLLAELSTHESERSAIIGLKERISQLLAADISNRITIADGVNESPLAKEISDAISASQYLTIQYNSATSDTVTTRKIFPLEITYLEGSGYIHAFQLDANEMRTFRLDRILKLDVGEADPDFKRTLTQERTLEGSLEIELEMGPDGLFFVEKHNEIVTSSREIDDKFFITVKVGSSEWITRTLQAWPTKVVVQSPPELVEALRNRTSSTLANYQ